MSFGREQLLPDEQLITATRQHPVVLLRTVLLNAVFATVLLGISYALNKYWMLLFYSIPLAALLWEIFVRHRREFIVTDRRVVRLEGVFSVSSFDAPLDKINNVFHEQNLIGRIFKYGKVGLETASEQGTTILDYIPNPIEFKNCIVRQRELSKTLSVGGGGSSLQQNIPRLLDELASLRDRNIITTAEFEAKKKALLDKL
jgi:uncharacterized membrane protein YdbT with pleckstrin-like domain